MNRKCASVVAAGILALLPTQLFAGGPPLLIMPIEGVTPENQLACSELLASNLQGRLWRYEEPSRRIMLRADGNQWYVILTLGDEIGLRDIETALKSSEFSVARDGIRLFGHVILQIEPLAKEPSELIADLEAMDFVSVESVDEQPRALRVTVDMPYPVTESGRPYPGTESGRPDRAFVGWRTFRRNATPETLPSIKAFDAILAKHAADLNDLRWSTRFACRQLGGVAVPKARVAAVVR